MPKLRGSIVRTRSKVLSMSPKQVRTQQVVYRGLGGVGDDSHQRGYVHLVRSTIISHRLSYLLDTTKASGQLR